MNATDEEKLHKLGRTFARFSEETYAGSSPLYAALAKGVAEDFEVLEIASSARGRPVPNLLFSAVHYLLLKGDEGTIASFYPSLTREPRPNSDAYRHFREFCLTHEPAVRSLLSTRLVQTNEVGRCAYMMPAFSLIANENPGFPLALVDIGTSAGLHLLWDRYSYVYSDGVRAGEPSSPVTIEAEIRGSISPPIPSNFPAVAFRVGIDLNPVCLTDTDEALWLRALIWPEHERRAAQLEAAIGLATDDPPLLPETPWRSSRMSWPVYLKDQRSASFTTTLSTSSPWKTERGSTPSWKNTRWTETFICSQAKGSGATITPPSNWSRQGTATGRFGSWQMSTFMANGWNGLHNPEFRCRKQGLHVRREAFQVVVFALHWHWQDRQTSNDTSGDGS